MQMYRYSSVLKVSGPVQQDWRSINRLPAELKMWPSLIPEILRILQKAEWQREWR
jgi:hypothetical protein